MPTATITTSLMDALSRCVSRTLNGQTTYYYYDGEKPIQEFDGAGNKLANNSNIRREQASKKSKGVEPHY